MKNLHVKSKKVQEEKDVIYDFIVSRAVGKIDFLLDICKNTSDKNTNFLFYKGSSVEEELDRKLDYKIYNKNDRNYVFIRNVA